PPRRFSDEATAATEISTLSLHDALPIFRADVYDRVSRNPEVSFGDTIEGDLVRRDFTVNAMAIELSTKTFVDPHGGMEALAAKTDRKSTRLNSSHVKTSYAVFRLKKKKE